MAMQFLRRLLSSFVSGAVRPGISQPLLLDLRKAETRGHILGFFTYKPFPHAQSFSHAHVSFSRTRRSFSHARQICSRAQSFPARTNLSRAHTNIFPPRKTCSPGRRRDPAPGRSTNPWRMRDCNLRRPSPRHRPDPTSSNASLYTA